MCRVETYGKVGATPASVCPTCFSLHIHPCVASGVQDSCAQCLGGLSRAEEQVQSEASFDLSHLSHSWDVRLAESTHTLQNTEGDKGQDSERQWPVPDEGAHKKQKPGPGVREPNGIS